MYDSKDELWIQFLNLDLIKFIVENVHIKIFVHPNNNTNSNIFFGREGAKKGFEDRVLDHPAIRQ